MILRSTYHFIDFFRAIWQNRQILMQLSYQDIKQRYVGSYMGILWAFINPLVTIAVLWFVFSVGFRVQSQTSIPFILWLISAMIPWFFIAETIQSGTNVILAKSYLVKKVKFRVNLLPLIQIMSSLFIHFFFVLLLYISFLAYGMKPSWQWLQVPYYTFSAVFLMIGVTWLFSSITVFFRDFSSIVSVAVQLGFWATPIFWSTEKIPDQYRIYLKFNPVYYITEGYRTSLSSGGWFYDHPMWTLYFWAVSILIFIFGAFVFSKLRPHFADVL